MGRHGALDFYHYDFYSQALAKIEGGYDRDRDDVRQMLGAGLIQRETLVECFARIRPGLLRYPAIGPAAFAGKVAAFTAP
ncbi:MAG: hypothetical protein M3Y86_07145 [Verrucomicrobiota bacterium]|nr:hypothetical protein [Verrucomicrobiota bacterium]